MTQIESPFDKETEEAINEIPVTETKVEGKETPASVDYAKYAQMAETPDARERRKFDYLTVSGAVETEIIKTEQGDVEKRKPAKAIRLFITQERDENDNLKSEELPLPLTIIPIKYRKVMEQRAGSKGEVLVLKTSEFNGKQSDIVTVNRFSPDGKVTETYGPMSVADARRKFTTPDGKPALRDKVHLYSLFNGELVRFVVKGTGLWEKESELHKGKTEESRAKYPFLDQYLSQFPINDPYFLYEMKVGAVYRDHGTIKYYRPTFTKGNRIDAETEKIVLEHLEDLHKYFTDMDEATKKFVPSATPTEQTEPTADVPFGSDADADSDY